MRRHCTEPSEICPSRPALTTLRILLFQLVEQAHENIVRARGIHSRNSTVHETTVG